MQELRACCTLCGVSAVRSCIGRRGPPGRAAVRRPAVQLPCKPVGSGVPWIQARTGLRARVLSWCHPSLSADPQRARRLLSTRDAPRSARWWPARRACAARSCAWCCSPRRAFRAPVRPRKHSQDLRCSASRERGLTRARVPAGRRRGAELRGAGAAAAERRVRADAVAAGQQRQPDPGRQLPAARAARAAAVADG